MPCVLTLSQEKPALPGVTNPTETNTLRLALSGLKAAATVAEPAETAVSNPELETLATDAGVTLQVALAVTSLVVLSLYVAMTVS
jgi:hypothetical protein